MKKIMIILCFISHLSIADDKKMTSEKILDVVNNLKVSENKLTQISFKRRAAFYYLDEKNLKFKEMKEKLINSKNTNKKITVEVEYPSMKIVNVSSP